MRIGLHSYSRRFAFEKQPGYDVFAFLAEASAWGFSSVEIMTGQAGGAPTHVGDDSDAHLDRVCESARAQGLELSCWSTYNDFAFVKNERWRQQNIEYVETWIAKAARTGVPNLRLLTGYHLEGEDRGRLEDLVIAATKRCCELAERHGVNLALENHSTVFLYADEIERLRAAVGSPRLTLCPDPTNGFQVTEQPEQLEAMYGNLAKLLPHATNAHLKVFGIERDGLSGFELGRVIGLFARAGYEGAIQLELVDAEAEPGILRAARERVERAIAAARGAVLSPARGVA
jgi:sugar phosphate isomerase/epimerase